jgi:hypothetical protein
MEIWLIQNGVKTGPFQDYEIRNRIADGQIETDQFAWHEGLPGWVKLREMDLFRDDLERAQRDKKDTFEPRDRVDQLKSPDVGSLSGKRHLARRFWARWLDLMLYTAIWWLLMYVAGRDIGAIILNPWMQLSIYLPWFMIEAWLLHRFGATPGKWLLGIRVVNDDDTNLTLKSSIWRSVRVWIAGIGFGWGLLSVLCHAMSWFTARRIGKPVWDYMGKHKITVVPMSAFKIITLVLLFFTAMQLQTAVRFPHEKEIILKQYPDLREFFQRGEPWHFPVKD